MQMTHLTVEITTFCMQNFSYLSADLSVLTDLCKVAQPKYPSLAHLLADT